MQGAKLEHNAKHALAKRATASQVGGHSDATSLRHRTPPVQPAPPPGEPEQPAEVELVLARGGFITLRSERGGEPASAGLRLFGEGGLEVTDLTGTGRPGFQDLISSSERRFGPLAPGSYEATALSPDGLSARATTQVEAGEESVVVIRFD